MSPVTSNRRSMRLAASAAWLAGCVASRPPPTATTTPAAPPSGASIEISANSDPNVAGALVMLDNELKGNAPLSIATKSGRHLIELRKAHFVTFSQWVTIKDEHQALVLVPRLVGKPEGPAPVAPNFWKYETTSSEGPSQRIVWEGGTEDFNGTKAFFLQSVVISANGATREHQRTYYDKGSDGVRYLGARGDIESTKSMTTKSTTLSSPLLALPTPFQADAKWDIKTTVRVATETSTGGKTPQKSSSVSAAPLDGENVVTGREQLTLPVGAFECLVVRSTTTQTLPDTGTGNVVTTKTTMVSWYAPTIGLVKSESTEDVASSVNGNAGTHRTATTLLASYHVTKPAWEMDAIGFIGDPPPGTSTATAVVDPVPRPVVTTAQPNPPVVVATAPEPGPSGTTANVSVTAPAPVVAVAGSGLPHTIGMADLSSASYFSLASRFGYFSLGNIGTGSATAVGILIEPKAEIAVTPAIKVEAGVPAAMVVAFYSDTAGSSSADMGFTLGNLWLGGRYIRRLRLPNGSMIDIGGDLALFLPTAHDSAKNDMSMSIAAGGASTLAEAFERSHDVGRYAPDQTTIHLAGDARMRHGKLFGQVELGIDQAWYTVMGVDGSQLWFRASLGGGAMLGASNKAAVLAELTTLSDFLDSSSGESFRSAFDLGFQFRKEKQLMTLSLYFPIDSFSRDHDYIGLQFTTHFGF